MLDTLQLKLYELEHFADALVATQLTHLTPVSIGIIFLAGLLTSLTPCMLSMLPITIGYIGGYETKSRLQAAAQSVWFSLGLATTLAALGILAAAAGRIYGQIGIGLPIAVSAIAILMGLNLLELLPLRLPNWGGMDWISKELPEGVRSYLIGLTFGLVASPCSTPCPSLTVGIHRIHRRSAAGWRAVAHLHDRLCGSAGAGRHVYRLAQKNSGSAALARLGDSHKRSAVDWLWRIFAVVETVPNGAGIKNKFVFLLRLN